MNKFFNKELFYRITSVLFFVPIVLLPLLYSNYAALMIYLIILSVIITEINEIKKKLEKIFIYNLFLTITALSFFLFLFLLITEKASSSLLITVIIIIWLFDTFSFLGGKIIGGAKLMPKISAGKTISGLITGILMTLLLMNLTLSISNYFHKFSIIYISFIILLSFIGDTVVSLLKRLAAIKDSGNIMPGHGGLLDRFDSFIIVFFTIGVTKLLV